MAIAPQPDSPTGEIRHRDSRDKVNEIIDATNLLTNPPKINLQITQDYTNDHVVTAAANDNLEAPVGFVPTTTPIGDPLLNGYIPIEGILGVDPHNIIQSGYDYDISVAGEYLADGFGVFKHTSNNTVVGFTFSLERAGVWIFSPRVVRATMANNGRPTLLAGSGLIEQVLAGDKLRLWMSCSNSGTAAIDTLSVRLRRIADSL